MKRSSSDPRIDAPPPPEAAKYATVGKRRAGNISRTIRSKANDNCDGAIRVYFPQGDRSILVPLAKDTTSHQVSNKFKVDALYLQIGNLHIKPLPSTSYPLEVQNDILNTLGYEREEERIQLGSQPHLRHIYAFFLGRPELQSSARLCNEILVANCQVRKGRLMHRWLVRKCILYNGTLRVEHENEEDEVFLIGRYKVDLTDTRRGRALRFSDPNGNTCFVFENADTLSLWLTRCQQSEMAPHCDLSDQRLVLLPDQLFSLSHTRMITHLNLRRNSLLMKSTQQSSQSRGPLIGWMDDVIRLSQLTSLDIGDNRLGAFPLAVCQMETLTRLTLSSNQISAIPVNIRLLVNLQYLDVSNNWLTDLPLQLAECTKLSNLNLSFNRLQQVPEVLPLFEHIRNWQLAGNYITSLHEVDLERVVKLDLRRNDLESSFRPPSGGNNLLWLDIRDNPRVSSVYLTAYPTLQTIHCQRLQLTSLHLNGSNLITINTSHNLLESIVIMPAPYRLTSLDVSHNLMLSLPAWLTDLPHIETVHAEHNQLKALPERIFKTPSLRTLILHNNRLTELPTEIENCQIETIDLHSNQLETMPMALFKTAHRLRTVNVSDNRLRFLPPPNQLPDLNRIQCLRCGMNDLDESVLTVFIQMRKLRILDLADNNIRFFDDSALCMLTQLEDLNLSSNRLCSLSLSLPALPSLQILRVHSNYLTNVPDLSHSQTLQIVDVSNNKLVHLNTSHCVSPHLKQLDLTCNSSLNLNRLQPSIAPNDRKTVSLVDIGEKSSFGRFHVGFSETNGQRNKLCIRQLRPRSRFLSPLFSLVDGGGNSDMAREVTDRIERFAESEEVIDSSTLKKWILRTNEWMGESGERMGAGCLLVSLSNGRVHCSSVGGAKAFLFSDGKLRPLFSANQMDDEEYLRLRQSNAILDEDNLINGIVSSSRQIGFSFLFPAVLPKPYWSSTTISPEDDCIILASRCVWDLLPERVIARILVSTTNPQVAAKKIQDAVQSFDWTGNISVIIVRFSKPEHHFSHLSFSHPSLSRSDSWMSAKRPEISELTLQKIEERLEKISEVISKIEDDTAVDTSSTHLHSGRSERSHLHDSRGHPHSSAFSSSLDVSSRLSSAPPDPPPSRARARSRENDEIRDRWLSVSRGDSRQRFEYARSSLNEAFKLQIPKTTDARTIDL